MDEGQMRIYAFNSHSAGPCIGITHNKCCYPILTSISNRINLESKPAIAEPRTVSTVCIYGGNCPDV